MAKGYRRRQAPHWLCILGIFSTFGSVWLAGVAQAQGANLPIVAGETLVNTGDLLRFEQCAHEDASNLRQEMLRLTQRSILSDEASTLDIARIVEHAWSQMDMDVIITGVVDAEIEKVRQDSNYLTRLRSNWDSRRAEQLAQDIAEDAFASEGFRQALEQLSHYIAEAVALGMEAQLQQGATESLLCAQEFIGASYGEVVRNSFGKEVISDLGGALDYSQIGGQVPQGVGLGSISVGRGSVAGLGVIVAGYAARAVMTRVGQRIGQRIAGRIASRLGGRVATTAVPIIGWVVGVGLIAYDLVEGNNGALPAIQQALTAPEVSQEIKQEIVQVVSEELPQISGELSEQVAETIYQRWLEFRGRFAQVLALAEREPTLRRFLDEEAIEPSEFQVIAQLAALLPQPALLQAAAGQALRNYLYMPLVTQQKGLELVQDGSSLDEVVSWWNLTKDYTVFSQLVAHRIPQHKDPNGLEPSTIGRLLQLSAEVSATLVLMPNQHLNRLLRISQENLQILVARTNPEQLRELSLLLAFFDQRNDKETQNALINLWVHYPERIERLNDAHTKRRLLESYDPVAFLNFVTARHSPLNLYQDTVAWLAGDVSWAMLSSKYSLPVRLLGFAVMLLMTLLSIRLVRFAFGGGPAVAKRKR